MLGVVFDRLRVILGDAMLRRHVWKPAYTGVKGGQRAVRCPNELVQRERAVALNERAVLLDANREPANCLAARIVLLQLLRAVYA